MERCCAVLEKCASRLEHVTFVYTIYVVDDNNILVGTLSLKKLPLSDSKKAISDIFKEDIIMVKAHQNNEEVANIMNKYDLVVLPVVNDLGQLIGRITADDVMEVIVMLEKDYHWLQEFLKI